MKIIKYIFEAIFIYFLFLIIKIFGLKIGRKIIAPLFSNIGFLFKSKKVVRKNISHALGNIPEDQITSIIEFMWKNYAYTFVEYLYLYKFRLNKFSDPQIKISGKKILDDLIQSNNFQDSFDLNHKCYKIMLEQLEKYNI